jgi:hypothetical protein
VLGRGVLEGDSLGKRHLLQNAYNAQKRSDDSKKAAISSQFEPASTEQLQFLS